MRCNQYLNKTLGESSIHGFPYLVKRELHWFEKLFWGLALFGAAYLAIGICLNQWRRFRDNPIVYAMELAWGKSNFPFVGVTLCSNSTDEREIEILIEELWEVTPESNATAFQYYAKFLKVLNVLTVKKFRTLEPYANDTTLKDLKHLDIILRMRHKVLPKKVLMQDIPNELEDTSKFVSPPFDLTYSGAITEVGICTTTSQLNKYTNPYGSLKPMKVSSRLYCDIMYECITKITPELTNDTIFYIYLHNVDDIVGPLDRGTLLYQGSTDGSLTIELLLALTTADTEVRNLPIAYRKCRYKDENILKYFEIYRPGLCRIECRINSAFSKCGCKPFFYVVAPHIPVCDIQGMLCLRKAKWPDVAQCKCLNLCQETQYIGTQTTIQKDKKITFERTIIVKLFLPRLAMKRRVVFSTDQLIMSFGGAIGLFLGASFISMYGLIYVLSEYVFTNCWSCVQKMSGEKKNWNGKAENSALPNINMKCHQFIAKTLDESGIHGSRYLRKRELHWLEQISWALAIIAAAFFSIQTCQNQWQRFKNNPIVYAMELAWGSSNYPFVGVTLCSNFSDEPEMRELIETIWQVRPEINESAFQYYSNFLNTLNVLSIHNLNTLQPYGNDTSLENLEYVDILLHLRHRNMEAYNESKEAVSREKGSVSQAHNISTTFEVHDPNMIYATAITEVGLCRTTSKLSNYTNPYNEIKPLEVSNRRNCNIMQECYAKIFPKGLNNTGFTIYLHNANDIAASRERGTIFHQVTNDASTTLQLLLSLTTAETEVRNLPVAFRKCRYIDENNLKYFGIYRPSLCHIECRINTALSLCGCKPFFYAVASHLRICDIKGMLCLSRANWPDVAKCKCLDMCQETQYIGLQTTIQKDVNNKFVSSIMVKIALPRMAMKRRVVFSTDQLIMSFGGAIGLFLGASFISLYGLLYILSEFIFSHCWSCVQNRQRRRIQSNVKAKKKSLQVTMVEGRASSIELLQKHVGHKA